MLQYFRIFFVSIYLFENIPFLSRQSYFTQQQNFWKHIKFAPFKEMLNYKNSLQNTSYKTTRKQNSALPTMNQFQTENTLSSPTRETRAAQINDIRGSIQGIINDVAKKSTGNRTAVETVSSVNHQIIDVLSNIRSPVKQTSMEHLIDPQEEQYYHIPNVTLSQSVGPQDERTRYRSPSSRIPYQNNNASFGSPIQYRSTNRTNTFGSPAGYGSGVKITSPNQKLSYDETEAPSSFNIGFENPRIIRSNLQEQLSPNQRKNISRPIEQEHYHDQGTNFDYNTLRSQNRPIPEQPLHQFDREDLVLLSEDLRKKLNDQIRRNNALFERCQELEHDNTSLRIASRKTSNNISQFKQNQTGSALRSVKNSGNIGYPADLLAELERLKEQNDSLRKDTIKMIRRK